MPVVDDIPFTSFLYSGGSGDRTASVTITTNSSMGGGTINNFIDGDTTLNTTGSFFHVNAQSGRHIKFDFGEPKLITKAALYIQKDSGANDGSGTWFWEASNDDITYFPISNTFTIVPVVSGLRFFVIDTTISNVDYYRYFKLSQSVGGTTGSSPWWSEAYFAILDPDGDSPVAPAYVFPGTGPRFGFITMTSGCDQGALFNNVFAPINLLDGLQADVNFFQNGRTGSFITFQFPDPILITEAKWYQDITTSHGTWRWRGSHDGSIWVNIGGTFTLGGVATQTQTELNGNTTEYEYYQLQQTAGSASSAPFIREIEFQVSVDDFVPSSEPVRITQAPLLVVHAPIQPARITQIPLLAIMAPLQGTKVTQVPVLPVWLPTPIPLPIPIVPDVPTTEIWQYRTVVNIAERSKEQRSALRAGPRIGQSFSALIEDDADRLDVYNMLFKYLSRTFNYPIYAHSVKMNAEAIVGATKLLFDPTATDVRGGEPIALFDPHLEQTVLVTVATVDIDGAMLAEPLTFTVPLYWLVCPAPLFRTSTTVGFQMDSVSGNFGLSLDGVDVREVMRPDQSEVLLTLVDGMLLLDKRPLADSGVMEEFNQDVVWLDNFVAPPEPRTSWFTPFVNGDRQFLVHRPSGMDYWRAVADNLRGRQKPFLLPTFREDFPLAEVPVLDATQFVSTNFQFFDFWRSKAWRYVRIQSDAGVIIRKINEVLVNYDVSGQPISVTVKLSASIGVAVGSNSNMVVSYVNTCRLDNDEFVWLHDFVDSTLTIKIRAVEE